MTLKNYYTILSIDKTASADDVRKAYLRMAVKFHPDKNPGTESKSQEKFKEIVEAYEVLSDISKRLKYDRQHAGSHLNSTCSQQTTRSTYPSQHTDISVPQRSTRHEGKQKQGFGSFYQRRPSSTSSPQNRCQNRVIEYEVHLPLNKMFFGGTHKFFYQPQTSEEHFENVLRDMKGMIYVKPGCLPDTKTLAFFPDGVPAFMRLWKFVVIVRQTPHPFFKRFNENLEIVISVPIQAIFTCSHMTVTGPDGSTIQVPAPSIGPLRLRELATNMVERWVTLANTGMPVLIDPSKRGLLFVKFRLLL